MASNSQADQALNASIKTYGPSTSISDFHEVLRTSRRVLSLCGAGLSAASGLSTFRGAGGMWRNHQATSLATPQAFRRDPGLVWLFYSFRRHKALEAKPNMAHYALAELARKMDGGFITLTQNVDGLSQRADHPREHLKLLHGSLFDISCFSCTHRESSNYDDPFHPIFDISTLDDARLAPAVNTVKTRAAFLEPKVAAIVSGTASTDTSSGITQPSNPSPSNYTIEPALLPKCPECSTGLLRPDVVWFGEPLPEDTISEIDEWISMAPIDIMLVIGTTAAVYPAAGYVDVARKRGARIVVVNADSAELGAASSLRNGDFLFEGDAAKILPQILEPLVGDLQRYKGPGIGKSN